MYDGPEAPAADWGKPDYKLNPGTVDDVSAERGMWVIGTKTQTVPITTTQPVVIGVDIDGDGKIDYKLGSTAGTWLLPESRYVATGPIVTVRPTEEDGGVLNVARRYVP
jgi:hypothetical protein